MPGGVKSFGVRTYSGAREDTSSRAQVGIGTLIVFIAMVLVAAIAAGVLIETAGFLQTQSEETGEQSSQQVTNRVQTGSTVGIVDGNAVDQLEINVKKAPGAGPIDIGDATIHYVSPTGSAELTHAGGLWPGDTAFAYTQVKGTLPTLENPGDVIKLHLMFDTDQDAMQELAPGESATLQITTASGGTTTFVVSVPDSIAGKDAVDM